MTEDLQNVGTAGKQPSGIRTVALVMFQFISMGFSIATPVMLYLYEHFSVSLDATTLNVLPISLISTLVTLGMIIGILVAGNIVGKIKVRTLAFIGSLLFTVFGTLPALFDNYYMLLVCRVLAGLGLGLINPLAGTIITGCYKGDTLQARLSGYGTVCMNVAGIIFQTLSGVLGDMYGWQIPFWLHLFGIISIVFSLLLPEPHNVSAEQKAAEKEAGVDRHIPSMIWFLAIAIFLFQMVNFAMFQNMSTLFDLRGLGAATEAAIALNVYTIIGAITGAIVSYVLRGLKHYAVPVAWAAGAIGALLIYIGNVAVLIYIGMGLLGFCFCSVFAIVVPWVGAITTPSQNARAITIIMSINMLGSFLGSYWLVFCDVVLGDPYFITLLVETFLCIVLCVVFIFLPSPWKKGAKTQADYSAA